MGTGSHARIVAVAPVEKIVAAFAARPCVVGNLVGRQAGTLHDFLRRLVEIGATLVVGNDKRATTGERGKGRALFDGELIEGKMLGAERKGLCKLISPI